MSTSKDTDASLVIAPMRLNCMAFLQTVSSVDCQKTELSGIKGDATISSRPVMAAEDRVISLKAG